MKPIDSTYFISDVAKTIGIILVVFGHSLRGLILAGIVEDTGFWGEVDKGIYLFHMPLFFFLTGLFLTKNVRADGFTQTVKKNFVNLICPMIIWSYIQFSMQYLAAANTNYPISLTDVIFAPFPPKSQFWFLCVMYLGICCFAPLLLTKRWRLHGLIILFAFVCSTFVIPTLMLNEWMAADEYNNLLGNFYIHIPYLILGFVLTQENLLKLKMPWIFSCALFILCLFVYLQFNPSLLFFSFILSIGCVLAVYKLSESLSSYLMKHKDLLTVVVFVGMNSLLIYLSHLIFTGGVRIGLNMIGITSLQTHLIVAVTIGIICPLCAVPVGIYLGKRFPIVARMTFPARITRRQFFQEGLKS